MDLGIKGKVALVTGGTRGLGRQCALSLAREGVDVAVCARNTSDFLKIEDELKSFNVRVVTIKADIMSIDQVDNLFDYVVKQLGNIDILVNNVGGTVVRDDIEGTSLEDLKSTFQLNVFGAYQLMRRSIPVMKNSQWGRIVNIASIWGRESGGFIGYVSAKAALIAITKAAAISLAKSGVLVNSIAPGSIAHAGGGWERFQQENPSDIVKAFIDANLPMGKFGWPGPVADLVAFLSSEKAGMITGACIVVDGGQSKSII
jgi:3-oxoacyl-[acyl-carrier protein] reductase